MALDFPASPTTGATYGQWKYDGEKWGPLSAPAGDYLLKAGGTMTGTLVLAGAPSASLHAATKAYADTKLSANQTITLSGDATGSGATAIPVTLVNTAVAPGAYTYASVTVDSKGRLTAASSGVAPPALPLSVANGGTGTNAAGTTAANNIGAVSRSGDTMTGDLTVSGYIAASVFRSQNDTTFDLVKFGFSAANGPYMQAWGTGTAGNGSIIFSNASAGNMAWFYPDGGFQIYGSTATKPGGGSWVAPSQASLKSAAVPWHTGLAEVLRLQPITYKYNNAQWNLEHTDYIGVDAEAATAVIPEMGRTVEVPADPGGGPPGHQTVEVAAVESGPLLYAVVNAIKEIAARLDRLEHPHG